MSCINMNNLFIGKNVRKPNRTIHILDIITMFELQYIIIVNNITYHFS